jgi:pyroglutamyl-peptidase
LLRRDRASQRKGPTRHITPEQLVDASEAMLLEMVRLTRQVVREGNATGHYFVAS